MSELFDEIYDLDNEEQNEEHGFVIDSHIKADWALSKIAQNNKKAQSYIEVCMARMDEYAHKWNKASENRDKDNEQLTRMLEAYYETLSDKELKLAKTQSSLTLPSGKMVKTFEKSSMVEDRDILARVYAGTDFVELVPKVKWAEFKKQLTISAGQVVFAETGEIAEGVTVVVEPAKFSVKVE